MSFFLGIDWGTHSSKWACFDETARRYIGELPLYGSEILRLDDTLTFAPEVGSPERMIVRSLKRVLIYDPRGTPFWSTEDREDTATSLGEAVVFSLCCLLHDAIRSSGCDANDISVGISFPNWLVDDDPKAATAARNFREAVAVAMEVVASTESSKLPSPGTKFPIKDLKSTVEKARSKVTNDAGFDVSTIMKAEFQTSDSKLKWGFITESGAAGLPYLRAMKIDAPPGVPGLAKLLVVDVGAGSTDIGYMLRTRHIVTGREALYYFAPAPSLPIAGNSLTTELMSYLRSRNEGVTETEAEIRKLRGGTWLEASFVKAWISQIATHVRDYVSGVPDFRWLPLPVNLNIVVTGGSGLVPGLKSAIRSAVRDGLATRGGLDRETVERIRTPGEHLPTLDFGTEAEYARRAVALGSSDSDRPGVNFIARMDAPVRRTVTAAPRWV